MLWRKEEEIGGGGGLEVSLEVSESSASSSSSSPSEEVSRLGSAICMARRRVIQVWTTRTGCQGCG